MCIRDSIGIDRAETNAAEGLLERLDGSGLREQPRFRGSWPVSYTHLRAHETVLDLV